MAEQLRSNNSEFSINTGNRARLDLTALQARAAIWNLEEVCIHISMFTHCIGFASEMQHTALCKSSRSCVALVVYIYIYIYIYLAGCSYSYAGGCYHALLTLL
jgi:hypothetical protein